jgi:hypothetical protein
VSIPLGCVVKSARVWTVVAAAGCGAVTLWIAVLSQNAVVPGILTAVLVIVAAIWSDWSRLAFEVAGNKAELERVGDRVEDVAEVVEERAEAGDDPELQAAAEALREAVRELSKQRHPSQAARIRGQMGHEILPGGRLRLLLDYDVPEATRAVAISITVRVRRLVGGASWRAGIPIQTSGRSSGAVLQVDFPAQFSPLERGDPDLLAHVRGTGTMPSGIYTVEARMIASVGEPIRFPLLRFHYAGDDQSLAVDGRRRPVFSTRRAAVHGPRGTGTSRAATADPIQASSGGSVAVV